MRLLRTAFIVAATVGTGLLIWQTARDLSTSAKLWEPITDQVS